MRSSVRICSPNLHQVYGRQFVANCRPLFPCPAYLPRLTCPFCPPAAIEAAGGWMAESLEPAWLSQGVWKPLAASHARSRKGAEFADDESNIQPYIRQINRVCRFCFASFPEAFAKVDSLHPGLNQGMLRAYQKGQNGFEQCRGPEHRKRRYAGKAGCKLGFVRLLPASAAVQEPSAPSLPGRRPESPSCGNALFGSCCIYRRHHFASPLFYIATLYRRIMRIFGFSLNYMRPKASLPRDWREVFPVIKPV